MKTYYNWRYEGDEFGRALAGGVKAENIKEARERVLSVLKLKKFKGVLDIRKDIY